MFTKLVLALVILSLGFSLAGAEMYKWVDENGVVTFKDTPPPASKKRRKVKVYNDSDFAPAPLAQPQPQPAPRGTTKKIVAPAEPARKEGFSGMVELYVTDWCGYCKKAQAYLKGRGIPYVAYDIEKDGAAHKRYKELGGRGVPLIIIGSNRMNGFSQESLEYYLNSGR
ncbi:DUF4124 domain-containing protein [Geobacter sp. FeAm09]|uniref:DUF4124 domain-containing protein n=1 Tax=Geobacter sp. FeAm09 TaxID=2597769 RepID=UPI0011EF1DB8|nr:DUF4124 domain-containing protein [Geobacter sp. FeAm09]QEM69830.1 DUF4124 domain-containing protein [Geobacter sp. FeAm09]